MKKYMLQYLEERQEDDDWDTQLETDDYDEAVREAEEMMEATNIDAVRILKVEPVFEKLDPHSWGRPWSKES